MLRAVPYLLLWCWLSGCGEEQSSSPADAAAGEQDAAAGEDAGADASDDEEMPALELERESSVRQASEQLEGLRAANQVLSLFVKQDPTLDLSKDACANANAIAARVQSSTAESGSATCADLSVSCSTGSAKVSVELAACIAGSTGVTVSGSVTATVTKSSPGGTTTLTVSLALADVSVKSGDDSYLLSGTISTSSSDLVHYAVKADVTANDYAVTFDGTVAASESAEGELEGLLLDGTGTLSEPAMLEMFGSWSCTGSSLTYTASALHRSLAQCRADAGKVTLKEHYACTSTVMTRSKPPRTVTSTADVTDVVTWDAQTPATGIVHVASSTTVAGQTSQSSKDVPLPGECP